MVGRPLKPPKLKRNPASHSQGYGPFKFQKQRCPVKKLISASEFNIFAHCNAKVAELADALGSGSSGRKPVGVQIPPFAHKLRSLMFGAFFIFRVGIHFKSKARTAKTSMAHSMGETSSFFPSSHLITLQLKNPQIKPCVME